MDAMDDTELLRRYAENGSEAAFSELVRRHVSLVHSIAMRQLHGDFHRANDVTQVVFTTLARKSRSLVRHTALTGWLYSCTYFSAAAIKRKEQRRHEREERAYIMNELLGSAEPIAGWDYLRPILDEVMIELNERDRETVIWRFYDRLPLALVGQRLGVSENAAAVRVSRALDKMRASLVKRGTSSTAAALALMLADHAIVAAPAGLAESVTATAVMSAAGVGSQGSWLVKFLGKTNLAFGGSGASWVAGIMAVLALGGATYELRSAWRAHAVLGRENEDYAARQDLLRGFKRAAGLSRLAAAQSPESAFAARDPKADFQTFLAANPEAREMILAENKDLIRTIFGSFFKSAGLTAAQIERFENLVVEYSMQTMTITPDKMIMHGAPLPPDDQMREVLGDQNFQQFQDYGRTAYGHYFASWMAEDSPGASFSSDQLDQLAQILVNNNPVSPKQFWDTVDLPTLASMDWDAVLSQAKPVFSASQWKALEPALLTLRVHVLAASARSQGATAP